MTNQMTLVHRSNAQGEVELGVPWGMETVLLLEHIDESGYRIRTGVDR